MHAWESIQKTLEHIEKNISEEIHIEELAKIAALSLFYYQRLFARLVKRPVREYIKLRRLAYACESLEAGGHITDIATKYGFGSRETFSRAFKEVYGLNPSEYRQSPVGLNNFDKPNLLLNYVMVDEGVPLISEGIVLEYNRKILDEAVYFLGVKDFWRFESGKMLGERPGVSGPTAIWDRFYELRKDIPSIPCGRRVGVSYHGGAPEGYSTYFAGAEVDVIPKDTDFASWELPPREYIVCEYEAEDFNELLASMGKMMKFTRFWLKKHGLIADGFFPEIYYSSQKHAYMEMWIPFKNR
ncbi:MAG: AraC family transcriptional regulator [Defluviitaleaceae bacterium]|nr:AraC family transcriptional regulator [Defluviitaleaceae bacterium]